MQEFGMGAMAPPEFAWQLGKTAEAILLVGKLERMIDGLGGDRGSLLKNLVDRIKNGERLDLSIGACARAAHEANLAYCQAIGDFSQAAWDFAPEWQKKSCEAGVLGVLSGNTPRQSHESWLTEKASDGWKCGPTKDPEKKEHPCFVPYDQLAPAQQVKDDIFVAVVRALAKAFGLA